MLLVVSVVTEIERFSSPEYLSLYYKLNLKVSGSLPDIGPVPTLGEV